MSRVPTCILSSFEAPRILHGHDPGLFVQIGSLTKTLTATVLTALAGSGVLALDDPLERFLPAPGGTGITLRHLAEHTSGLPRLPEGIRGRDPYASFDDRALDSVVRRLDTLATAPPGSTEEYSNLGYALLGAALVAATRTPYEELLRRHLLDPLGVTDVTADPPADVRLCRRGLFGQPRRPWTMTGAILPAGGLWATPGPPPASSPACSSTAGSVSPRPRGRRRDTCCGTTARHAARPSSPVSCRKAGSSCTGCPVRAPRRTSWPWTPCGPPSGPRERHRGHRHREGHRDDIPAHPRRSTPGRCSQRCR